MIKFPLWKYLIIILAIIVGFLYTLPNFYGDVPAVQISGGHSKAILDNTTLELVNTELSQKGFAPVGEIFDGKTLKLKFPDTDTQLKARDIIQSKLGENYVVALNLISASPSWLSKIHANPMFLGLDLRGGLHFLLEVDMNAAMKKTLDKLAADIKRDLRNSQIRYGSITVSNNRLTVSLRDTDTANLAYNQIKQSINENISIVS